MYATSIVMHVLLLLPMHVMPVVMQCVYFVVSVLPLVVTVVFSVMNVNVFG